MSGCYLSFSLGPRSTAEQIETLQGLQDSILRLPGDAMDCVSDSHFCAVVVRQGGGPSWGISRLLRDRYRLILGGWAWRDESASQLCSPDEALEALLDRAWGQRPSLCGHYLLLFLDTLNLTVVVESDLFGVIPCYYRAAPGQVLVSSEIKTFARLGSATVDRSALAEIARFGYVVTDRTVLAGVKRLPPSHRLTFRDRGLVLEALTVPSFTRSRPLDVAGLEELTVAFERHLDRVRSLGSKVSASLSGGLDSRIVVAALVRRGFEVTTFSVGVHGSLEVRLANQFSHHVGASQLVHEFDGRRFPDWFPSAVWITEGRCPPGQMHFLDAMLEGDFPRTPQFNGLVGDAVIGGDFDEPLSDAALADFEALCRSRIASFNYWPRGSLESVWGLELAEEASELEARILEFATNRQSAGSYSGFLWFRYAFRVFGFTIPCLGSQVVPWTALLAPYLDDAFFRLAATFRAADLLDRAGQIRWGLRFYPEIGVLPRLKDGAVVPLLGRNLYESRMRWLNGLRQLRYLTGRLTWGRLNLPEREGYPLYDQWYRKWPRVRDFVHDTLLSRRSLSRGLWWEAGIRSLLRDLRIGRNVWNAVGTVLQLELLFRQLLDGEVPMQQRPQRNAEAALPPSLP